MPTFGKRVFSCDNEIMSHLWNQPGVPQKDWRCVDVVDLRADGESRDETDYETCEMCGNEKIRYVHIMEHDEYDQLQVGCVCAEKMSGDYVNPKKRQNDLQNLAKRRAKCKADWSKREWKRSSKGNLWTKVNGVTITIFLSQYKQGKWVLVIDRAYSQATYDSEVEAQLASFDQYWQITHKPK